MTKVTSKERVLNAQRRITESTLYAGLKLIPVRKDLEGREVFQSLFVLVFFMHFSALLVRRVSKMPPNLVRFQQFFEEELEHDKRCFDCAGCSGSRVTPSRKPTNNEEKRTPRTNTPHTLVFL